MAVASSTLGVAIDATFDGTALQIVAWALVTAGVGAALLGSRDFLLRRLPRRRAAEPEADPRLDEQADRLGLQILGFLRRRDARCPHRAAPGRLRHPIRAMRQRHAYDEDTVAIYDTHFRPQVLSLAKHLEQWGHIGHNEARSLDRCESVADVEQVGTRLLELGALIAEGRRRPDEARPRRR